MPEDVGVCPRCGQDLIRGFSPKGKVLFFCPSCGGRAVTLPTLHEALGAQDLAAINRAARAVEHVGCCCPGCGADMTLLKVGTGDAKIEIDVCGRCLTIWCDSGEFEHLCPPQPPSSAAVPTMRDVLIKASPEARERFAASVLNKIPTDVSAADHGLGDVLGDVARLVAGVPTLWRNTSLATPFLSILLCVAIPALQAVVFGLHGANHPLSYASRRDFWVITQYMAELWGFSGFDNFSNVLTAPFIQYSGLMSFCLAIMMFPILVVIERRLGFIRLLGVLVSLWGVTLVTHVFAQILHLSDGFYCGFVPIALGVGSFALTVLPDARLNLGFIQGTLLEVSSQNGVRLDLLAGFFLLTLILFLLLGASSRDYLSLMFVPSLTSAFVGVCLGRRSAV